ncbi:hypothetical protein [Enterococcus faecium]|uniref:Uncharacterized protein n=1 Tax=Enterococcus faecium TaxID=1352 RepID=A0A9X3XW67_ENTFC|nr:hypothetical protein [Enterococcus faecium]MDC4249082.1 hypothetical protein [Enterococcus faecium]
MNKRLITVFVLLGMGTRLFPVMIQLGLFFSLFLSLFMSWDDYMYEQTMNEGGRMSNEQR